MPPLTIGLTGGIAAGSPRRWPPSSGSGAATISSDAVVHELLDSEPLLGRLVERWGRGGGARGQRRPRPDRRDRLRRPRASSPGSSRRSTRWSASGSAPGSASLPADTEVAVVEVPLLFEAGMEGVFDTTVAVVTADEVRRERAAARGHALVDEREARQLTQEEKAARADARGRERRLGRGPRAGAVRAAREADGDEREGAPAAATAALGRRRRRGRSLGAGRRRRWSRQRHVRPGDPGADPAAAPRGHHPPAGRRKGRRRGADRRRDLLGVEVQRPDLERRAPAA